MLKLQIAVSLKAWYCLLARQARLSNFIAMLSSINWLSHPLPVQIP